MCHEDSKKSHSLQSQEEEEIPAENNRRSQRGFARKDYKVMNSGSNQRLTVGDTTVFEHMALNYNKEGYIEVKLLDFEPHSKKRLYEGDHIIFIITIITFCISGSRMKLDLTVNEGKYLSAIYDLIPSKFECVED